MPALRSIEHGFIPPILDLEKLDSRILVGEEESFYWTKELMDKCGVFAGVSCGAVSAAAVKVAKKIDELERRLHYLEDRHTDDGR